MDQIRNWSIYKITSPKNRVYIGKTCNIKKRFTAYRGLDCKNQKLIYRSLLKYGPSSHRLEVIDSFRSNISFANGKEIFWIRTYMSDKNVFPEMKGMNMCAGGRGTIGRKKTEAEKISISLKNKGFRHTEEAKIKISQAAKGNKYSLGRKHSKEWKETQSKRHLGNKYNLGRRQSIEIIEKRVSKIRGKKMPQWVCTENRERQILQKGKKVLQYSIDGVFLNEYRCISEAAELLHLHRANIRKSIHGIYHHTGGFIFKYKNQ